MHTVQHHSQLARSLFSLMGNSLMGLGQSKSRLGAYQSVKYQALDTELADRLIKTIRDRPTLMILASVEISHMLLSFTRRLGQSFFDKRQLLQNKNT